MKVQVLTGSFLVLSCLLAVGFSAEVSQKNAMEMEISQDVKELDVDHSMGEMELDASDELNDPDGAGSLGSYTGCRCSKKICGCCNRQTLKYLLFVKIKLNVCISVQPLPRHYGAVLIYALNHRHVFRQKISMKYPPRVCRKVPQYPHLLTKSDLCLEFYNVNTTTRYACTRVKGYIRIMWKTRHVDLKLGCFTLPKAAPLEADNLGIADLEALELSRTSNEYYYDGLNTRDNELERGDDLERHVESEEEEDFMFDEE